jgi:hypothetical protein
MIIISTKRKENTVLKKLLNELNCMRLLIKSDQVINRAIHWLIDISIEKVIFFFYYVLRQFYHEIEKINHNSIIFMEYWPNNP